MSRNAVALVVVALALAVPARAQEVVGSRPSLTRLAWPVAEALVHADTNLGAQLLVSPTHASNRIDRVVVLSIDPQIVEVWANRLAAIVGASGKPPEGVTFLGTRLPGRAGGEVVVARLRDGDRWKKEVVLDFRPAEGEGFAVPVTPAQAEAFGNAILAAASQSQVRSYEGDVPGAFNVQPGDVVVGPRTLHAQRPQFPQFASEQRIAGGVWLEFIVDETGRVRYESTEVLYAAHRAFAAAAREALAASRFAPGTVNGRPVAMRMRWRQLFLPEYD